MYTISEFAKLLNISTKTLRNWDKNGKLKPIILPNGHRRYTSEHFDKLLENNKTKYHYLYKIKNKINGHRYYGIHSTYNLDDDYMGSGKEIKKAYKEFGRDSFEKTILKFYENRETLLLAEAKIVSLALIKRNDIYNKTVGGTFCSFYGKVVMKTKNGKVILVDKDEKANGVDELSTFFKNKIVVKDEWNNILHIDKDDPRYLSGELVGIRKGISHSNKTKEKLSNYIVCKDLNGDIVRVHKDNILFKNNTIGGVNKGKIVVSDKKGNKFQIDKSDDRFRKDFQHVRKNLVSVKDENGNTFTVHKDDPRYISGELVGVIKGFINVKDKDGNIFQISNDDPRYLSGELVGVMKGKTLRCPHCNKIGGHANMKRYHFDNCRNKS